MAQTLYMERVTGDLLDGMYPNNPGYVWLLTRTWTHGNEVMRQSYRIEHEIVLMLQHVLTTRLVTIDADPGVKA